MIRSNKNLREDVITILSAAFDNNKSVNYVVKQDVNRENRIRSLVEYSYDICNKFGDVFISEDKKAAALLLRSDKKKATPLLDLRLALKAITIPRVLKVMNREAKIKKKNPKHPYTYLWFIGVHPDSQKKGVGTKFLQEILEYCEKQNLPVCLETSTISNIPWYKKHGFQEYNSIDDFGFKLYMMSRGNPM